MCTWLANLNSVQQINLYSLRINILAESFIILPIILSILRPNETCNWLTSQ